MISKLRSTLLHWYTQYELITCVSMLEPWEKMLLHSTTIAVVSLITYSSIVYLPQYTASLWEKCKALSHDTTNLNKLQINFDL
ncbi:hypothetical protein O3M35_004267 [Rhynocoris fuscipes]|uniref:Serine palmitoyltransferase small subunit B n=1 Tax=Rhynocoris fuscipes TaxID=488301 RepID=A0AAW1CL79_9HEMI